MLRLLAQTPTTSTAAVRRGKLTLAMRLFGVGLALPSVAPTGGQPALLIDGRCHTGRFRHGRSNAQLSLFGIWRRRDPRNQGAVNNLTYHRLVSPGVKIRLSTLPAWDRSSTPRRGVLGIRVVPGLEWIAPVQAGCPVGASTFGLGSARSPHLWIGAWAYPETGHNFLAIELVAPHQRVIPATHAATANRQNDNEIPRKQIQLQTADSRSGNFGPPSGRQLAQALRD